MMMMISGLKTNKMCKWLQRQSNNTSELYYYYRYCYY